MQARHFAIASAALLVLGLVACAPEPEPGATQSPSPSEPTVTATPTPSETPTEEPDDAATPVTLACDALISPQAMYDYNSNFSLDDSGSAANGGRSCVWVNQSSGEKISLSVAHPASATYDSLSAQAKAKNTAAPELGTSAYFDVAGGTGTARDFTDGFVTIVSSSYFLEPADVEPLLVSVLESLGV